MRTVDPVHTGDMVAVELNTGGMPPHHPSAEKAVIVYADRDILVVNKRAGMAMYETYNHHGNALSNAVAAAGFDGPFRPIYRLDKDTSGLVVLARPAERRQAGRSGTKGLLCGGTGTYTGSSTVDAPIAHCPDSTVKRCVDPTGVRAVTHWEALGQQGGRTLLRVQLETGRTHQIRVHFAHLGTPLVGDSLYGIYAHRTRRHLLHCKTIRLMHPVREEPVAFDCPFPSDMEEWNQCLPTAPTTSLPASCCPP